MLAYNHPPLSSKETKRAKEASAKLLQFPVGNSSISLQLMSDDGPERVDLPAGFEAILRDLLQTVAEGHGVTVIPLQADLTTNQAADILNVSRPYLIKLLDAGEIPHHKVGRHRRIRSEDVLIHKRKLRRDREAFLDRLVAESQELGLYD
jgi:excisionase family DNA binding protein